MAFLSACDGSGADAESDFDSMEALSAVEELRIGSLDGEDDALTFISAMVLTDDGGVISAHPRELLMRSWSPSGELRWTTGREGEGPGEFRGLVTMEAAGDSLWAFDSRLGRFSFFEPHDGSYLSSFTLAPAPMNLDEPSLPRPAALLQDGSIYAVSGVASHLVAMGVVTEVDRAILDREGAIVDPLPSIAVENSTWAVPNPEGIGGAFRRQPFADGPLFALAPDDRTTIVVHRSSPTTRDDAQLEVVGLSPAGDTVLSADIGYDPEAITADDVDSILPDGGGPRGSRSDWAETLYRPTFKTGATRLEVDRTGRIWVRSRPGESGNAVWWVLSPRGEPRATVVLPAEFTLEIAAGEILWGTVRNELDVPYIVRLRVAGLG